MATYYVRINGSDTNSGLTAALAWRTVSKALGSSGIASGDTLYIGAGKYKETITVNMTSAVAETLIIGDFNGLYTGDPGRVIITAHLGGDFVSSTAAQSLLVLNGRNFLTFRNICFIGSSVSPSIVNATTTTSTNIKYIKCSFEATATSNRAVISQTVAFGIVANWLIDSCVFFSSCQQSSTGAIDVTLTTGAGSDWDSNIVINNCLFHANGGSVLRVTSSGTAAQEGGGVIMKNCTILGGATAISTTTTRVGGSTFAFPVIIKNCLIFHSTGTVVFTGGELGALVENYNCIYGGLSLRTNVATGRQTKAIYAGTIEVGYEYLLGNMANQMFIPKIDSVLNSFGNKTDATPQDILSNARNAGANIILYDKNVTSATPGGSITDLSSSYGTGVLYNNVVKIISGLGAEQTKTIRANSATVISGDGQWITTPDSTSKYIIYSNPLSVTSIATSGFTSGNATRVIDIYAAWQNNIWEGFTCAIISGSGSGSSFVISGNSATIISGFSATSFPPSTGSTYHIYWGSGSAASGINYIHGAPGCFSRGNTALKSTGIFDTSPSSIRISGPGSHNFYIPVDATPTTFSVKSYYDSFYSGIRPQMLIYGAAHLGVSDNTGTNSAAPDFWTGISLTFTPSGKGVVTVLLRSNATGAGGSAYFDDLVST
jgi:hypothetical protein